MSRYVCKNCGVEQDPPKRGAKRCANCDSSDLERQATPAQEEYGRGDVDEEGEGLPGGSGGRTLDVVELMERWPRRREE